MILAALLAVVGACSTVPEESLLEVPEPDLSTAEVAVRQQIEAQQQEVEQARGGRAAELGGAYGELGLLYLVYAYHEAAEVCLDNARELMPDDVRWPYYSGYLLQIRSRLEEAAAAFERVLELRPDDSPASLRLAAVRLELGGVDAAEKLFSDVLATEPRSAAALDGLGKVAAARGDDRGAVDHFERALELQPGATGVHHTLGLAYRGLGDLDKARYHLGQGGETEVRFADPLLSSMVELGRSAELYRLRAGLALREQRYQRAAELYRQVLAIDPSSFGDRKALGFSLEKLGDVEGAVAELEEALRSSTRGDPEQDAVARGEILRILGGLRVLQGRDREALEAFRRSVELDPANLDGRGKLANALARQGDLEPAVEHYDHILAAEPDRTDVLVRRATALINLDRPRRAIADFERAVAAAPEDAEVRLRFAEALDHLGDAAGAGEQRAAAAGLVADPGDRARLLTEEAGRRLRQGEIEGALEQTREALRLDSANVDARYQLATILGHLGRLDEALAELERVIEAAPRHGPARRAQVTALVLAERFAAVRSSLQAGLEALPRDRGLAHALARLLASAPAAGVRDAELSLRIATRVHQQAPAAATAETLAMAFAESGRFAEALELQRRLADVSPPPGASRPPRWGDQLRSYEASRPWRIRSADEIVAVLQDGGGASGG